MPPIREYLCNYCGHQFDEIVFSSEEDDYRTHKCRCGSTAKLLPTLIGGYTGATGGSSTRPKNSTSMKKTKAYTGTKEEQLELDLEKKQ